jgi:hypothetical protein
MFKFSFTVNDKQNSISPKKGIDIEEFGALIQDLKKAINPNDGSFCTMYKISNTGYTPNFLTDSKQQYENFISVHQNIYERPLEDLRPKEMRYAKTLKEILHKDRFIESFGNRSKPIVKIQSYEINKSVDSYSSITNIFGIVAEMGSPDFNKRTHIFLNGHDYKIYTTSEQDSVLKEFYRTRPIELKIKQKKSIKSNRVISATLVNIIPKTAGNLMDNIKLLSEDDLSFLKNTQTHEDILTLIRS